MNGRNERHALGTVQDLTQRTRAEHARRESEQRFAQIFRASPIPSCYTDAESGRLLDVNTRWEELLGHTRESAVGRTSGELDSWVDIRDRNAILAHLNRQGAVRDREIRLRCRSGKICTAQVSIELLQFDDQQVHLWMLVDITERKRCDDELRMQSLVIQHMVEGVTLCGPDGTIIFSNRAAEAIFGYPAGGLLGHNVSALLAPSSETAAEQIRTVMQPLRQHGTWEGELSLQRQDGSMVVTRTRLSRIEASGPRYFIGIHQDITERKNLESQLLRSQRMESVGRLAGGIAHDMNNILAPIMMAAPMLRSGFKAADVDKLIGTIETSATRGANLIKQLLLFSRGVEGQRLAVGIKDLVREIHGMMTQTFPKNIIIDTYVFPEICAIRGDPTQLHQVLLNLCLNARDAMPEGGTLTLRVQYRQLEVKPADSPTERAGSHIVISVSDTGVGISKEHLEKIFDPFFTTKPVGKGTGLGLPTVLGIVKSHGGHMDVRTELGQGTTFEVFLPAGLQVPEFSATTSKPTQPVGCGETVLVVDDEPNIREVVRRTLLHHGYKVLIASDGVEATSMFARHGADINLVVTDIDMPHMDGLLFIKVARTIQPNVKVVISTGIQSGFRSEAQLADLGAMNISGYLLKPYVANMLLTTVSAVLKGDTVALATAAVVTRTRR